MKLSEKYAKAAEELRTRALSGEEMKTLGDVEDALKRANEYDAKAAKLRAAGK